MDSSKDVERMHVLVVETLRELVRETLTNTRGAKVLRLRTQREACGS
jgi:hypothetical protein